MQVRIEHIDDVLPHIPQDVGIVVTERPGLRIIDYVFTTEATFPTPMAQECRGLKFAPNGRILARPLHKFFNIGERQSVSEIEWSIPHVVLDKLDGSMIHPCFLGDRLTFMTRLGESRHAKAALSHADAAILKLSRDLLTAGMTPVFEFTSPENRVVLAYSETKLTLIAVRETISGAYLGHTELMDFATRYGVPLVEQFGSVEDAVAFMAKGRGLTDVEGYVVAFENGHRIKLKADAYVLRHKALAGVSKERNLLEWIAKDAIDDVLPLLADDIAERVATYRNQVFEALELHVARVNDFAEQHESLPRKEIAFAAREKLDQRLHGALFAMLDGKDCRKAVRRVLTWASRSDARMESIRDLFDMAWDGIDLEIEPG
ncbi:RNA ligase [Pelagibius sp. Alg239-R121]|uniref:RNA ligase n=1 Tax=Pelagibius sp. Alg239-R121 TaxID=2993448 RepID=UPI0024A6E64F|nr:RNA ligase [Pelagibius sp. Alg239-R121]